MFFSLRANDAKLQADVKKSGDKAGQTFGQSISASLKKSFSGQEFGKGLVQGLGFAGALGAANLAATAISKVTDVLGDAVQAAIQEEQSLAKLDAALRANIKGWDGNSEAIEATLKSRMRLGFADDEQRESLALLVGATKDYNKALAIQRTAMDLARLKGISLKDASEALIRVEGGQFRLLKSLGIELGRNATQTEALAAVQAVANGQAEAYAETTGGKLLASQIKVDEALEELGTVALPLVAEAAEFAAHTIQGLVFWWETLGDLLGPSTNFEEAREHLLETAGASDDLGHSIRTTGKDILRTKPLLRGAGDAANDFAGGLDGVTSSAYDAKKAAEDLEEAFEDLTDAAYDAVDAFGDQAYSADELRGRLADLEGQLFEAKRELLELEAIKNPTAAQQRDIDIARGKVAGYRHDIFDTRSELARLDKTTLAGLLTELAKAQYRTDLLGDEAREALALFQKLAFSSKNLPGYPGGDPGFAPRADGGPVWPGQTFVVGERGPELFVPKSSGDIIPTGMWGGGGNTYEYHIHAEGQLKVPDPLAAANLLARFQGSGMLPEGGDD